MTKMELIPLGFVSCHSKYKLSTKNIPKSPNSYPLRCYLVDNPFHFHGRG